MSKVTVDFELRDAKKSVDGVDASGKRLNKTLERTKELTEGTRGGSRAAKAAFQQTEYGTARGTIGTGASGRDFAKQSRELDGLVRLYAVYAANIFAAGAAFRALSEAMDTTNMIQGLNQLGAASGVAMGGLAKRFSEASGGAISLRESMEATAKAVSSGLSQSQFLKLGDVAKKASQALGVNMSDAVSRLTRGITKLEPELLDELGIFTKVGKATEDYARAIGKPVSALTDFEKRQAFANAVLEEGAKKFGQIDIPTNPYDKLLATLKNVAQAGLEIVNNVLGPFANLLAKNSGLLVGVLALIGAKIVKDALPAIGQWRAGLKLAADEAKTRSSDIAASFGEKFLERTNAAFKVPDLQRDLATAEAQYKASRIKFSQIDNDYAKQRKGSQFYTSLTKGTTSPAAIQKEINNLKEAGLSIDSKVIKNLEEQKRQLEAVRSLRKQLTAAENAALDVSENSTGGAGDYTRRRAARNARARSERLDVLSNVSTNAQEQGFLPAIRAMNKELSSSKTLDGLDKFRVRVGGVFIAAANSVGIFMSAFSNLLGPVMAVVGILTTVLPLMRNNEEEAARFAASLDLLKENSENAFRVLERLSKLDPLERISLDSLDAKATALESLGGSLTKAFDDFETELKNRNWADSTLNFLSSIIGRSSEQLLSKQVGKSIERAVMLAGSSEQSMAIKTEIANMLGLTSNATFAAINSALDSASPALRKSVSDYVETAGKQAKASTGSFKAFRDSLAESGKIYQDLINTTKNSTPLTKFAEDSTKKIIELEKALSSGTLLEKVTVLADLSKNINFLQLFPPEVAKNLLGTSIGLEKVSEDLAEIESRQRIYNKAIIDNQKVIEEAQTGALRGFFVDIDDTIQNAEKSIRQLKTLNSELDSTKAGIKGKFEAAASTFAGAMRQGLIANIDIFAEGLKQASAKAALEIKKAALGGIADEVQKIKIQGKIEQAGFALDKAMLEQQAKLLQSNLDLKIAIMENTLAQTIANSGVAKKPGETDAQSAKRLKEEQDSIRNQQTTLDAFNRTKGQDFGTTRKELEGVTQSRGGLNLSLLTGLQLGAEAGQARASLQKQFEDLQGKSGAAKIGNDLAQIDAAAAKRLDNISKAQQDLDLEAQTLERKKASMGEADYLAAKARLDITKAELIYQSDIVKSEQLVQKSKAVQSLLTKEERATNEANVAIITKNIKDRADARLEESEAAASQAVNIASQLESFDKINAAREQSVKLAALDLDTKIGINQADQQTLSLRFSQGQLDEESYKRQLDTLKIAEIRLDTTKQLTAAEAAYNQEIARLDRAKTAAGGELTGGAKAADESERARQLEFLNKQRSSILALSDARLRDAQMVQEMGLRQKAYTDLFTQAFKGMEDAIINFTKTGKLSFSSMIDSFIEGLLRYEIQQQQKMLFEGMGGPSGLATSLMGFLGFGVKSTPFGGSVLGGEFQGAAKGAAYDVGLRKFAQGGMFTNSIVSSPTLFKFAQGTGLMGEAGPEAIMPLKRDSSGNLGVRAGTSAPTVDVVVNNFGNQQATTKETTDSRGNRRIEVMIGDAVAGELSRPGSSVQQSLSGNFGNKPALARR